MNWLVSLQLLSGILFVHRKLRTLAATGLLDEKSVPKLFLGVVIVLFFITYLTVGSPRAQLLAILAITGAISGSHLVFRQRLRSCIQQRFPDFLNKVILSMKTGLTFRASCERLLASPSELWEKWLRATLESQVFLEHPASSDLFWWKSHVDELRSIHQAPHRAMGRLESLRRKLRVASEFRRKSGQALLQARLQMVVMTCLYVALIAVTMNQFHF